MSTFPDPLKRLVDELVALPSIGPRHARRLAFHLVGQGQNSIRSLAGAVTDLQTVKLCSQCFYVHQNKNNLCDTCNDSNRMQNIIMIVEKETDLLSLENTRKYRGRYLILGSLSKTGALDEAQKLRVQSLVSFLQKNFGGQAEEIILGLNPSATGDFTAGLLTQLLKPHTKKFTRLGRGLPRGGEIEFADDDTLGAALESRS